MTLAWSSPNPAWFLLLSSLLLLLLSLRINSPVQLCAALVNIQTISVSFGCDLRRVRKTQASGTECSNNFVYFQSRFVATGKVRLSIWADVAATNATAGWGSAPLDEAQRSIDFNPTGWKKRERSANWGLLEQIQWSFPLRPRFPFLHPPPAPPPTHARTSLTFPLCTGYRAVKQQRNRSAFPLMFNRKYLRLVLELS